nr:kinesin-like protein KIF14 [Onthophagus taurus]
MAVSAPCTPKLTSNRGCKIPVSNNFETPKSAKIRARTSKENDEMGVTPKRMHGNYNSITQTPKCYNKVIIETPVLKTRSSRDKNDEISNLTVAVRIRPMNARELSYVGSSNMVRIEGKGLVIPSNAPGMGNMNHYFEYDHIFWSCDPKDENYSSQERIFNVLGDPILDSAFKGYNGCLFAYGQTGSGKSYSMMGDTMFHIDERTGIIPRFCQRLFEKSKHITELDNIKSVSIDVSYFEIYNEKIYDLLAVSTKDTEKTALKVREHPEWGPYVVNLSVHSVNSYEELREWLIMGNKNRATAATAMNEKSSRSHSIFSVELSLLEDEETNSSRRSKISLIDLAGSERLGNSSSKDEKTKQGVYINKSLLTLGKVICALSDHKKNNQFVPYRESVLTWLLRESLGGNSLTSMLATISPANSQLEETLATLRYACQARSIINRVRVNENSHDRIIKELQAEVERLRALRQECERRAESSIICIDELEDLRHKLQEAEEKRDSAKAYWERRYIETTKRQQEELAEAERRKEELESRLRVMHNCEKNSVVISPYKSNFFEELKQILDTEEKEAKKIMSKEEVLTQITQVFDILSTLNSTVDKSDDHVKILFAKANKYLQAFESALCKSYKTGISKSVTFNI